MHKWCVYEDFDQASKAAADFIANQIESSIQQKDVCHMVLPGGNTPAKCLSYLVKKDLAWEKVHWYLGDERCYPPGHEERNDLMLQNHLWSYLPKSTTIHRIPAELGPQVAARIYRDEIRTVEHFDIAFLGMGEDGHTASLFPDNEALKDIRSVVPVYNAPKEPDERVSLGVNTLRESKCRIVLVSGHAKADIINRIKNGTDLPVNSLGDINWYLDTDAVDI